MNIIPIYRSTNIQLRYFTFSVIVTKLIASTKKRNNSISFFEVYNDLLSSFQKQQLLQDWGRNMIVCQKLENQYKK